MLGTVALPLFEVGVHGVTYSIVAGPLCKFGKPLPVRITQLCMVNRHG